MLEVADMSKCALTFNTCSHVSAAATAAPARVA